MADNDNISQVLPSLDAPPANNASLMSGVRPKGKPYASIRINLGQQKPPIGGKPEINPEPEQGQPDTTSAIVLDTKIFHPVPEITASRLSIATMSKKVWTVGQAPDIPPGALVVVETGQKSATDENQNGPRLDADNSRRPAGPDSGISKNPTNLATSKVSGSSSTAAFKPLAGSSGPSV